MKPSTVGRGIAGFHALVGSLLLIAPRRVASLVASGPDGVPPTWMVRLLGLRVATQAGFEFSRPTPDVLTASAVVDGLHATSMLPVLVSSRYRRAALASAGMAAISAAGLLLARSQDQ